MTRAEKRRQAREEQKNKQTYTLTLAQIDMMVKEKMKDEILGIKDDATDAALNTAMELLLTLPLHILITEYWQKTAKKRCPEFTEKLLKLYSDWQNGEVNMGKLKDDLWEYGGIGLRESEVN